MKHLRQRIERWFESFGRWVYDHRWTVIIAMAAITLPLAMQLPSLTIDNRTESLFLEGDPAIAEYNAFRDQFGMDEFIIVAISPPEVFDLQFLARLKALHQEIEEKTPYVAEVTSLINARNTYGDGDTLRVEELMETWPRDPQQLADLRSRVLANPLYVDNLISADGTFTTIVIRSISSSPADEADVLGGFDEALAPTTAAPGDTRYLTSDQHAEMVQAVSAVVEDHRGPDFPVHLTGGPVVLEAMNRAVIDDLTKINPLAFLIVIIVLFLLFRRLSGVVYPLLIVILALLSTLGVMAVLDVAVTNITTILTSFLTVVGVADAVHILSAFYQQYRESADKRASVAHALGHSGLAVLMTSVTTASGLLSFAAADVGPIADLGVVAPIGIGFALIFTVALLPALIAVFPVRLKPSPSARTSPMDRLLAGVAELSCGHPKKILAVGLVVTILAAAGMTRLRFSQNGLKWFKESSEVRRATELIDDKLRGTLVIEVVIDSGRPNGLYEPAFLNQLERSMAHVESLQSGEVFVGKATSLDSVIKEINRALNENRQEFYTIPQDRDLIAQELLLFEGTGSDDLEKLVDRELSKVRCTLKMPFRDAFHYLDLIDDLNAHFKTSFPRSTIQITGSNALYVKMFHNIITTMAKSYVISLSIITLLMIILIGRFRIGVLSMVPNLLPLVTILGIMGWLDIPLDMSTVLIGSVAIGLVVDDTIHFMHNFRRYYELTGTVREAVARTLDTAGRAILVTSLVLSGGFFVCMASTVRSTVIYGALMGTTVMLALLADYFVTPALMAMLSRHLASEHGVTAAEVDSDVAA